MRLGVPYVLHEANVLPGRVVSLFSRWASAIAGSFEETRYYLRRRDLVLTGMPLGRGMERAAASRPSPSLDRNRLTVLVMGGSRGSRSLNEMVTRSLCDVYRLGYKIQVVHLAGREDEERVRRDYTAVGIPHEVHRFAQSMTDIYEQTDLAICRSGAATCAELSAFGIPALLIPYPYAANDHQTANARAMEKMGAADVVPEQDLSVAWLKDYVAQNIQAPSRLARMSAASKARSMGWGAGALADLVERAGRGEHVGTRRRGR
jgi:UDP-N-acetylglucosamine--N-acetylmuramyl-(pentapeptide) pyrophosphoryl-undecaprenol N-acetylglucosamine transferase